MTSGPANPASDSIESHPSPRPIPAASAVLLRNGCALLVQRGQAPNAGYWSFPGGKIRAGEKVEQAALRELAEETGVQARVIGILAVLDVMAHEDSRLCYHYLLVVMQCRWLAGEPRACDDADDARWIPIEQLRQGHYRLTDSVLPVLDLALARPPQEPD